MLADGVPARTVRLATARIRGAPDRLRARRRLEHAMAGLEAPAGPEIVFIRSLRPDVPLPLQATQQALSRAALPAGAARRSDARFVTAVQDALRAKVDRARRPWLDDTAAAAEAVVFADEAELLACLLRDCLRGRLAGCWWASAVLRGRSPAAWVHRSMLVRGDLLPAVVGSLAVQGCAVDWVTSLAERDAWEAIAVVAAAHGLDLPAVPDGSGPDATAVPAAEPSGSGPAVLRLRQAVPELARTTLSPARRSLLALTLGLHRAGAWVRGEGFRAVWPALVAASLSAGGANADDALSPAERRPAGQPARGGNPPAGPTAASATADVVTPGRDAPASAAEFPAGEVPAGEIPSGETCSGDPASDPPPSAGDPPAGFTPSVRRAAAGQPQPPRTVVGQAEASGDEPASIAARVHTRFGGLFYLLNVALALDLYGDFSQPRRPGLDLSPWDWLALIGLAWFGGTFRRDPLYGLLADLAGRPPGEPPGRFFRPPGRWQVADDWLASWPASGARSPEGGGFGGVCAVRGRLQIRHPAGFLLLDVPRRRGPAPLAQAQLLCAGRPLPAPVRLRRLPGPLCLPPCPPPRMPPRIPGAPRRLQRWLGWLLPYVEARLVRALGSGTPAEARATVCRHEAVLGCTPTRLDVTLSLDTLPIAIRLAGLDRDPGWFPAAGRSVAFHFR